MKQSHDTITLTLHKKWFDLIFSGEKKEEYREVKPYWIRRFCADWPKSPAHSEDHFFFVGQYKIPQGITKVRFRNGYAKNAPEMVVEWLGLEAKEPNPDWCEAGDCGKLVFALKLGEVLQREIKVKPVSQ